MKYDSAWKHGKAFEGNYSFMKEMMKYDNIWWDLVGYRDTIMMLQL